MELINKDNSHTSQIGFSSTSVGGKRHRMRSRRTRSNRTRRSRRTRSNKRRTRSNRRRTSKSKRKQRGGINVNPTYSSYSTVGESLSRSESALASTPSISKMTKIY
jgi:hypothetical protein